MPVNAFLARLGFSADPFESTNASEEPGLPNYFVPPPYFTSILGNIDTPKSHVILAPRGGGKTAQRLMIENDSIASEKYLCVTYDEFDIMTSTQVSWAAHMKQICRLLLVGILVRIDREPLTVHQLSDSEKRLLKQQVSSLLGNISAEEFARSIRALKNFADHARDYWNRYGGLVASLVNAFIAKHGFDKLDVPTQLGGPTRLDDSLRFQFSQLLKILQKIGFRSTYILVVRVDELPLTAKDAKSTFSFIYPLLTDLSTLETEGVAFKFFLWDQIGELYSQKGSRPDRIKIFHLKWSINELKTMLAMRLKAYSEGKVGSLNDLISRDVGVDLDKLVVHFAAGSPRDMIRVCHRIVDEETRASTASTQIGSQSVWMGLRNFAQERSEELFGAHLPQLRRPGSVCFTINQLANDVFRISTQAARNKVQNWMNSAAVTKMGELPNKGNRPLHLFGATDLRLAVAMLPAQEIQMILANFAIECPSCGTTCMTDQTTITCHSCDMEFQLGDARSLMQSCSMQEG